MTDLSRDYLIDGYISHTFGRRDAEYYMVILFKVDAKTVVATCNTSDPFFVFNQPSCHSPASIASVDGRSGWLLDFAISFAGSVVPQRLKLPQRHTERIRYINDAKFRLPVFLLDMVGSNYGVLGVPVKSAPAEQIRLKLGQSPQPFTENTELMIHFAWPGYHTTDRRVRLTDCTPERNHINLESVVQIVRLYLRQYLFSCEHSPIQPSDGRIGHGNIALDEVMLIGLVQISEGSWMPILQLRDRIVQFMSSIEGY